MPSTRDRANWLGIEIFLKFENVAIRCKMCFIIPFKREIQGPATSHYNLPWWSLESGPDYAAESVVLESLVLCSSKPAHSKFSIHFENDIHSYPYPSMEPLNFLLKDNLFINYKDWFNSLRTNWRFDPCSWEVNLTVRCLSGIRILSGFSVRCLSVRILSVSILSGVRILSGFLEKKAFRCLSVRTLSVSILSAVRILSGFLKKTLSAVCLSGRTRTRQSCPDFRCPCPPSSDSNVKRYEFALLRSGY